MKRIDPFVCTPIDGPRGLVELKGTHGMADDSGRYYPYPYSLPNFYSNPPREVEGPIKTGDIIQVSMPLRLGSAEPFGYNVWHYRVNVTINNFTIQAFADGVQQEVKQAATAHLKYRAAGSAVLIGQGVSWGPCQVLNLSQPGFEANADDTYRTGTAHQGGDPLSLRTCAVVIKHTAVSGKTGLGRFNIAPIAEGAQRAGELLTGIPAAFEGFLADLANMTDINGLSGANATMVIYNQTASKAQNKIIVTPVSSVSCHPILGSIRGRARVG